MPVSLAALHVVFISRGIVCVCLCEVLGKLASLLCLHAFLGGGGGVTQPAERCGTLRGMSVIFSSCLFSVDSLNCIIQRTDGRAYRWQVSRDNIAYAGDVIHIRVSLQLTGRCAVCTCCCVTDRCAALSYRCVIVSLQFPRSSSGRIQGSENVISRLPLYQ